MSLDKKRSISIVWCCILNTIIIEMTCETYVPALPAIKNFFNASEFSTEFIVVAYLCGLAIAGFLFGPISDITGRRKILIGGSIVFFLSSLLCYFSYTLTTIYPLIFINFMQGLGGGSAMIASFAGVRDKYSGNDLSKVLTKLNISISVAPAIGPIIGSSIVYYYNWHYIFLFLSLISFVVFMINMFTPETNQSVVREDKSLMLYIIKSYKGLFKNRIFFFFTIMQIVTVSTIWGEISNMPFIYIENMKVSNIIYGYIMMLIVVAYIIGAYVNQRYVDRVGRKFMIYFGICLTIVLDILIIICHYNCNVGPFLLTALKIPTSFALPFVTINSTAIALNAVAKNKGTATAFLESAQSIGGAIYVYLLSIFYNGTMIPLSTVSIFVFGLVFVLHFMITKENPKVHSLTIGNK